MRPARAGTKHFLPRPGGEIGRHNGLKIRRGLIPSYRFDSGPGHHAPPTCMSICLSARATSRRRTSTKPLACQRLKACLHRYNGIPYGLPRVLCYNGTSASVTTASRQGAGPKRIHASANWRASSGPARSPAGKGKSGKVPIIVKVKINSTEFYLFVMVVVLSIAANLPEAIMGKYIDQRLLLIVLAAVVVIALFRYLRLLLFLCVATLAVGANIPERLSETLGLNQTVMLFFLILIVMISQANRFLRLPLDVDPHLKTNVPKLDTAESRKAVLIAISRGNVKRLKWFHSHNTELNFSEDGVSPVTLAAEKGNSEIMQLLIYYGVNLNVSNAEGKTPLEIAEAHGFNRTAEIIRFALEHLDAQKIPEVQPLRASAGEPTSA